MNLHRLLVILSFHNRVCLQEVVSLVEELCHGQIEYVDGKSMSEDKIKKRTL